MSVRIVNDGPSALVVNVWETLTPASFGQNVERFDLAPGETSPAIEVRSWSRGVTVLEAIPAEGKPPPALSPNSNVPAAQAPPVEREHRAPPAAIGGLPAVRLRGPHGARWVEKTLDVKF